MTRWTLILMVGCADTSPLVSGTWTLVEWLEPVDGTLLEVTPRPPVTLQLDVDAGTATFDVDGEVSERDLQFRDRSDWIEACPTNFAASRVEVADLGEALTLGERELISPFVMADCRDGPSVYVGAGTPTTGGGGPCGNEGACLTFR